VQVRESFEMFYPDRDFRPTMSSSMRLMSGTRHSWN